jgi:hypothetical protein
MNGKTTHQMVNISVGPVWPKVVASPRTSYSQSPVDSCNKFLLQSVELLRGS